MYQLCEHGKQDGEHCPECAKIMAEMKELQKNEIIKLLDGFSPGDRMEIFNKYCTHCGGKNPRIERMMI